MLFFQPDTNTALDTILKVTPATMAGYGLALAVLAITAWVFYKSYQSEKEINRQTQMAINEFQQTTIAVLTQVETRLNDQQGLNKSVDKIEERQQNMIKDIHTIKEKVSNLNINHV